MHPEDISLLAEKIERARVGSNDLNYDIRLQMSDGSIKYLRTDCPRDPGSAKAGPGVYGRGAGRRRSAGFRKEALAKTGQNSLT